MIDIDGDKIIFYDDVKVPEDTVMSELREWAQHLDGATEDLSIAMAVYMLGFSGYNGFY